MADKIKGDLFLARALTRTHKSPAVNPATFSDSDSIYSSSFSHHVITKPSAFRYAHVHAPTPERITQIFHDKFYASKIQRYIEGDHPLSRDDFFKIITEDPTNANTTADNRVGPNLISVLIGRIGIGKSTLISNLMIQYRRAIHNANLIPVVVDVENLAGPAADKNEFYRLLYIRLYESVVDSEVLSKRDAESLLARCNPSIDSKDRDLQAQLYALATKAFLVELFHETGHRVLLFLDNVDKYYYLFDRGGFSEEGDLKRQASMQKLEGIIAEFESPNGVIDGAGLNVLVCMRRYTLEYLIATGSVVPGKRLNLREDGSHIFRLAPCSADQVIESRVRLLQEALRIPNGPVLASSIEGRIRAANRIWDSLKKARERAEIRMLDDLSHLGNHGHRSLIDYFSG
jgi:hypothetical protein